MKNFREDSQISTCMRKGERKIENVDEDEPESEQRKYIVKSD